MPREGTGSMCSWRNLAVPLAHTIRYITEWFIPKCVYMALIDLKSSLLLFLLSSSHSLLPSSISFGPLAFPTFMDLQIHSDQIAHWLRGDIFPLTSSLGPDPSSRRNSDDSPILHPLCLLEEPETLITDPSPISHQFSRGPVGLIWAKD